MVHSGGIPRPADKQSNAEMRVGLPIGDEAALIASAADPHWFSAQTLEPSVPARERRKPFVVNHCLYATFPFVPYIPNAFYLIGLTKLKIDLRDRVVDS